MRHFILTFLKPLLVLLVAASLPSLVSAQKERKIKLTGNVADGVESRISIDQIEALGLIDVTVDNPYENGPLPYSGVMIDAFVNAFGAEDVQKITTIAIDDYRIEWTRDDWETLPTMLVSRVEGERIGIESRGPLRIVFPEYENSITAYEDVVPKWMWMIVEVNFE